MDEPPRVLIVEDETAVARGFRHFAEKVCSAVVVRTLREARQKLTRTKFAALMIDVALPDGSGIGLLRQVRETSTVPVLILTASEDRRLVNEVQALRAEFVFKPVEPDNIVRFVEHAVLRHPDPRRRLEATIRAFARKSALTQHEALILELLVEGASRETVASTLAIAPSTLKTHIKHILFKTRSSKLEELVRILLERAVTDIGEITQLSEPLRTAADDSE